eukprot:UN05324
MFESSRFIASKTRENVPIISIYRSQKCHAFAKSVEEI